MRFSAKCVQEVLSVVSENPGVSPRTVAKLKAECPRGNLVSPKRRPRDVTISSMRTVKHDSFTVHAIRLKVQSMYAKREIPTLESVRKAVNEDDDLPNFTKTTLFCFLALSHEYQMIRYLHQVLRATPQCSAKVGSKLFRQKLNPLLCWRPGIINNMLSVLREAQKEVYHQGNGENER
ncbi:hypothetical protein HPB48_020440 [Haemaphysalis longicornis]|uniref:Uncharacterized protein n=1 Tax=Haemaphysalis longicornis TaxID=44386 RepID=A0A9J6GX91_HAELO|nr:hypothetical protein HPB48_020440 [Haemaphysalis longicornis]